MNNTTYTVKKGDTLYGISKQFNTSMQTIRELNSLTNDNIYPGQVLIISAGSDSNPSECVVYTVKKGDNLYNIAKKYDTTVDDIKRFNNLSTNNLSIGQQLKIPCYNGNFDSTVKPNYVVYTVQKGDSLYSIANKYKTTVDKIKKDNNLVSNDLSIGKTLIIDDFNNVEEIEECYGDSYQVSADYIEYIVKRGDNLYNLAKQFNLTVSDIKAFNGLTTNNLSIGQILKIPTNNSITTYTVQNGDSLYSIANKFNTTVNSIKTKNNLTSNLLNVGQKLII